MRLHLAGCLAFLLLLVVAGCSTPSREVDPETHHPVRLLHPGIHRTNPVDCVLVQVQGKQGKPDEYYTDVDSVFCKGTVCRIVKVRLYWDELGFYNRLVLARDVQLEKGKGESFTREDYRQLNRVLANRNTTVWDLNLKTIGIIQVGEGVVDATSSATVSLDESQYVVGAAWTCYTLWHWVNGGVNEIIRTKTAAKLTVSDFRDLLKKGDDRYQVFALEQLIQQECHDPETVAAVQRLAATDNVDLLKPIINYAESSPAAVYCSVIGQLIHSQNQAARVKCLDSILATQGDLPPAFVQRLAEEIAVLNSYPEINLLLRILAKAKQISPEVRAQIMSLLDNSNVIIARRAYWFLREQNLTDAERARLDQFQKQHADVL